MSVNKIISRLLIHWFLRQHFNVENVHLVPNKVIFFSCQVGIFVACAKRIHNLCATRVHTRHAEDALKVPSFSVLEGARGSVTHALALLF